MCKKSLAVKFYTVKPMYQQSSAESCAVLLEESFLDTTERNVNNRNSLEDGRPAIYVDLQYIHRPCRDFYNFFHRSLKLILFI